MHKNRTIALFFAFIILSCGHSNPALVSQEAADVEFNSQEETNVEFNAVPVETEQPVSKLTLLAAGDNLFHEPIINFYRQDNEYDFSPIYSEIKTVIENADLAFINQETVMAGVSFGYSGYPRFNTPQSLAKVLSDAGFDIINIANNHAMDMGSTGLESSLDLLNAMPEFTVLGARKSGERFKLITQNNITLGFLAYTYGLNGFVLPAANPNLVSLINRRTMEEEINALRPLCDFLIVSVHWGDEYRLVEPGPDQISLARFLAELNVDLIIGHHPHVLQRVETFERPDGKEMLCFYSLGNFVSNHERHPRGRERILGGMMLVTFSKKDGELFISDSGLMPIICHYDQGFANTKVFPLYLYTKELLQKHQCRIADPEMTFDYFYSVLDRLETRIIMHNPYLKDQLQHGSF